MYVRWVVRRHKNANVADTSFHDAYLIESYRDQGGNPRQRTICYLGNIRQLGDSFPPVEREIFMLRAERILESVSELSSSDRELVMDMLRQKVPSLSDDEVEAAFIENLRWFRQWWEQQRGAAMSDEEILALLQAARGKIGPI
jgi:hypothetical protein